MPYNYEGLEPIYIDIAKKELKEDPKKVHAHIASLRNWLKQSRHIQNCPDDDAFLLRFLRIAKFDHESAQSRLDNFCTLRGSKERGSMKLFNYPSVDDPIFKRYLEYGVQTPCGFNSRGELVILMSMDHWEPSEMSYLDFYRCMLLSVEAMLEDERCQIAGMTAILDLHGFSKKQFNAVIADKEIMKDGTRIWQDGSLMRNKEVYYYREPLIFDILFNLAKIWIKPKLLKRINRVKDDLTKIHAKMPGAKEILPKEYGGQNGTIEELTEKWRKRLIEYGSQENRYKAIYVDESLRPKDTLKFLNEYQDIPDGLLGTKGTFTKIEAD